MNEDFLTRWSRRKRDVVETEQAKSAQRSAQGSAPDERDDVSENAVAKNVTPVEPAEAIEPAKPAAFDLKSLPPIESITAATDIRPFLAPGVPVDIARAALRRAWSADPRIRDFVGLADYDWDYHTPGSAAGFGPLEMTDELRRMVARIVGDIVEAPDRTGQPATSLDEPRALAAEAKQLSPGQREPPLDLSRDTSGPSSAGEANVTAPAALQHESPQEQRSRIQPRRGHGRALPR